MTEFILVWVLVTGYNGHYNSYSPPVKTLEDCQRIQKAIGMGTCVQVNVLRGYVK